MITSLARSFPIPDWHDGTRFCHRRGAGDFTQSLASSGKSSLPKRSLLKALKSGRSGEGAIVGEYLEESGELAAFVAVDAEDDVLGVGGFELLDCGLAQVLVKGSEAEVDVRHTVVSKRKRCFLDLERFQNP